MNSTISSKLIVDILSSSSIHIAYIISIQQYQMFAYISPIILGLQLKEGSFIVHAFFCDKLLQFSKAKVVSFVAIVYLIQGIRQERGISNTIAQQFLHFRNSRVNIFRKLFNSIHAILLALPSLAVVTGSVIAIVLAFVDLEVKFGIKIAKVCSELQGLAFVVFF